MDVFPERLKYGIVIALHKKSDVSNMVNYRPISLLPLFLKTFEKAICWRLNQQSEANNILATEQYGFRKVLATQHATVSLIDNIGMAWNYKIYIGGIFCDLTKSFDSVNCDVLITKFKCYRYRNQPLNVLNLTYQIGDKEQN